MIKAMIDSMIGQGEDTSMRENMKKKEKTEGL